MKERPILFKSEMVKAILEGRKTQTRRVVKYLPEVGDPDNWCHKLDIVNHCVGDYRRFCPYGQPGDSEWRDGRPPKTGYYYIRDLLKNDTTPIWYNPEFEVWGYSPYDDPESIYLDGFEWAGWKSCEDRLWVRETCRAEELKSGLDGVRYMADNAFIEIENTESASHDWCKLYNHGKGGEDGMGKTVPSIFMPRWASRITLKVKNVRVERLQDITEEDAKSEGCEPGWWGLKYPYKAGFSYLWESINKDRGYSWDSNAWLWVVEFEMMKGTK